MGGFMVYSCLETITIPQDKDFKERIFPLIALVAP